MKIKVEISGHQHYNTYEAEVVRFCDAVEYFDGKPMQVPAVVVQQLLGGIGVQPLQRQSYTISVTVV